MGKNNLKPNIRRFVDEFIIDGNAAAAYQRAGYKASGESARRNASRLLTKADVQEAIFEALQKREQRTQVTSDEIIRLLYKEATECGENSSHAARVSALANLARINGMFIDRKHITADHNVIVQQRVIGQSAVKPKHDNRSD